MNCKGNVKFRQQENLEKTQHLQCVLATPTAFGGIQCEISVTWRPCETRAAGVQRVLAELKFQSRGTGFGTPLQGAVMVSVFGGLRPRKRGG